MNAPFPEEFPPHWLAAYADGELDADDCARVEAWLRDHPAARDLLKDQQDLSPANASLWAAAEPPPPTAAAWAVVRSGIEAGLAQVPSSPRHSRMRTWLALVATSAAAAAIAWLAFGPLSPQAVPDRPNPPLNVAQATGPEAAPATESPLHAPLPRAAPASPLAEFAILPMAADDDIVLERVPALRSGWLPNGQHPVPGVLELATQDDVLLEEVNPSAAWPAAGGPKMTTAPGDAPMIFAAKPW